MPVNPPGSYGTLSVLDTLAANFQTVAQIGEDTVWAQLQRALDAHNEIVQDMREPITDRTTDRLRRYGTPAQMTMDELDEYGTADAQKITGGVTCGFPLKKYGGTLQWTRTYMQRAKGNEIAAQMTAMMDADVLNIITQTKRTIFGATNYAFIDKLVDNLSAITLPVKAFVNADGAGLPVGPNGEIFNGATHTHYAGASSAGTLSDSDLTAHLNTVLEHYATGSARININQAQEAAIRAFTPNFQPYVDPSWVVGANTTYARGSLDMIQIFNRKIGTYRGAEVWIRPWMPASYVFTYIVGQPKPLAWRYDSVMPDSLQLVFDDEEHPLRAKMYERNFGVGVWNRTNGAILDVAHTTYAFPTGI